MAAGLIRQVHLWLVVKGSLLLPLQSTYSGVIIIMIIVETWQ